ncbi:unnamed protein product [Darwinula stevensoni]|uniref:Myosin motor domain-containing protein n=1 Tax=Darwinula stevensoni TaxID=69355 RepID=A0A7R8XGQ2_9CRUS|nr:unnamed protein product [Darwinula stevensoni]CAG0891706.1 unnamed protein product [Darwinula stevensoni]
MIRKMVVLSSENDEPRSRCSPTVKDLTELSVLTEESALKHLSERYEEECVYTWAGPTLVSLNPCKQVPRLYKKEFMEVICTSDPHVWSMAKLAFTHVGMETKDQAIVISGESGAGKMMAGLAMEELERFGLEPQQVHRILPCTIRPSDATAFHNTCSALHKMGMTPETLCCLLKILAGILHLGDIHFKKDGVSVSIDKGGILDIYGFEWLERNSLEQLCINYANERLQHLFATGFLEETRKILSQEGIGQLTDESFTTEKSLSCLDILHGPKSVMGILNEECQLKRDLHASEERLPERLKISLCPHACVHVSCVTKKKGTFIIKHYAGNVEYSLEGMLEKNKDEVPDELLSLLMESQNPLLQEMAKMHGNRLSSDTSPRRTQRKITILAKFKMSLDNLLGILSSSHVHYIRCIRPNNEGLPNHFSNEDVHRQLAACGIYETIQISQAGFRVRVGYGEFLDRFGVLARGSFRSNFREVHVGNTMSPAEVVQKILKRSLGTERVNQECRFGHTRLFGTENVFEDLETTLRTHQDVAEVRKIHVKRSCLPHAYNYPRVEKRSQGLLDLLRPSSCQPPVF